MVLGLTMTGMSILKRLQALHRVRLEKEELQDYWRVQFPQNQRIPLFYAELLGDLQDNRKSLQQMVPTLREESSPPEICGKSLEQVPMTAMPMWFVPRAVETIRGPSPCELQGRRKVHGEVIHE